MDIANKLESVVANYLLSTTSSSALMISGKWGSGKTYFFKNKVIPLISEKGLIPIYVSLNGIDSQEQLKKTIYSTLTTTMLLGKIGDEKSLGNLAKKRVEKLFKNVNQIPELIKSTFGEFGELLKLPNVFEIEDFIILEDVVFCLDDLERISDNFRIKDLLGFINSEFVEHKNLKVILIGNETKRQLKSVEYASAKEKVIGWTYDFKADLDKVALEILENRKDDLNGKLKEPEYYFVELISTFNFENLRTFIFTVDCLNQVLNNIGTKNKSVFRDVIYFTVIICQEYKKGKLNFLLKEKELPKYISGGENGWGLELILNQEISDSRDNTTPTEFEINSEDYRDEFKLYLNNRFLTFSSYDIYYHFFKSIYDFILTGFLDTEELANEIKSYSNSRKNKNMFIDGSPLQQLNSFNMLTNEKFSSNVEKIYEAIENGEYGLGEFALAFVKLSDLSNIDLISGSINELIEFFEKNVNKAAECSKKIGLDDKAHIFDTDEKIKKIAPSLYEKINSHEEEVFQFDQNSDAEKGFQNWINRIDELGTFTLIIQKIPPERISEFIFENIDNRKFLQKFHYQLREAFKGFYVKDKFSDFVPNLKEIKLGIENFVDNFSLGGVDKYWLIAIDKLLAETIKKFEPES